MDQQWQPWNLESWPGGISSAVSPDLLPPNQCAWGMDADFRGTKVQTRPNIEQQLYLPPGLVQGAGFFNIQGGMLIVMISGIAYRIRIGVPGVGGFSWEAIPGTFQNSPIINQVWMAQTVENFLIQDGQSDCIIYNGSTARRANQSIPEVPRGTHMAYANGRLWVAGEGNQLAAGNIYTGTVDSELSFTETQYLSGGGTLSFSDIITGLAFIPSTGTSDYGPLLVFGRTYLETVRADVTDRDSWSTYPGFVTNALRSVGTPSGWTIVQVNEDLFWRDVLGGIRSLNTMLTAAYFAQYRGAQGDANVPISREVLRLTDYESQQLLGFSSGVYFNNRMLMTSSPFLNKQGGVSFKDLISLDFAPVSTMQGQSPPAYNGSWQGVNWTKLVQGEFNGLTRAFGISSDEDGVNRLWEFDTGATDDLYLLSDGTSVPGGGPVAKGVSPIQSFVEYPRIAYQDPKKRKRLTRCDVWLSNIVGEVSVQVWWRPDNYQKWTLWDSTDQCAIMTDGSSSGTPHVWKNLLPEQRPLVKTFSIPEVTDPVSDYDLSTGFGFQVRVAWTGSLKIERVAVWAEPVDDDDYVNRDGQDGTCEPNDVTGNEIRYQIPLEPVGTVATPTFIPSGGSTFSVAIATTTPGATIIYTTDGSTPSRTNGLIYSSPFANFGNTTVKAFAFEVGWVDSGVATGNFTVGSCASNSEWNTWKNTVISQGGGFTANSQLIACNLISALQSRSYSSRILALYPLLGTTANGNVAMKVPLRNSLSLSPANSPSPQTFSENTGISGGWMNGFAAPNSLGASMNGGVGYWENNISFGASVGPAGSYDVFQSLATSGEFGILLSNSSKAFSWGNVAVNNASVNTPAVNGHYYGQRSSSTSRKLYLNGSMIASNTTLDIGSGTAAAISIYLLRIALNNTDLWPGRCACFYLTDGTMSDSDISDFHSLLQTYLITPTGR